MTHILAVSGLATKKKIYMFFMQKSRGSRVEKCTLGDSQHGSPHVAPWDLWGLAITFHFRSTTLHLGKYASPTVLQNNHWCTSPVALHAVQ